MPMTTFRHSFSTSGKGFAMKGGFPLSNQQRHSPLILALVALVALQLFRADHQWHVAFVVADSALMLALAAAFPYVVLVL